MEVADSELPENLFGDDDARAAENGIVWRHLQPAESYARLAKELAKEMSGWTKERILVSFANRLSHDQMMDHIRKDHDEAMAEIRNKTDQASRENREELYRLMDGYKSLVADANRVRAQLDIDLKAAPKRARAEVARKGGHGKRAIDPASKVKEKVKLRWEAWQRGERPIYEKKSKFIAAMRKEFPGLQSDGTVGNWTRHWEIGST